MDKAHAMIRFKIPKQGPTHTPEIRAGQRVLNNLMWRVWLAPFF